MTSPHAQPATITVDDTHRVSALTLIPPSARACYVFAHGAGAGVAVVTTMGYSGFLIGPALIGFTAQRASIDVAFIFIADHTIRPALIGGATKLPFLWVLLGILGGVETLGLLGLFVGPAIMAVLILLWRQWTRDARTDAPA